MRVGLYCSGVGPMAAPAFIKTAALAAERTGFSTIWMGEHVVLFESYPHSSYPYASKEGANITFPPANTPLLDPFIALSWVAALTSSIEVGSGVLILPQRNPVVLAKELMTLDVLSGGRVVLGAGVGWAREEYAALGIPWRNRAPRMDESLGALRALWRDEASSFHGETVDFERAFIHPKPVRGDIPILIGGESDAALRRVARFGDGWLANRLQVADAPQRIDLLRSLTREQGRDPDRLRVIITLSSRSTEDEMRRYRDAGATEFNLLTLGELPLDEDGLRRGIAELGRRFVEVAARL